MRDLCLPATLAADEIKGLDGLVAEAVSVNLRRGPQLSVS
jgi:hypothetical protein